MSSQAWRELSAFDEVVARYAKATVSFTESDALGASHWELGEDGRLREDIRFRPTPWGRWVLSNTLLANDALYDAFVREQYADVDLGETLNHLSEGTRQRCVLCPADDRFVIESGRLRLSAKQLSRRPLLESDVTDLEKYRTHLPVHSLKAAAASEPAGEWGRRAQEEVIETLGWLRVTIPGRSKFNNRMFVAQIEGHSMDDGRSGLVDGGYAVFELWPSGTEEFSNVLVRGAFSDPESGSYAVKRYQADARDEEGCHREIRLVSLNADRVRYPDIVLQVDDEDDVTVVANVIKALSPDNFARKPKLPKTPGRRDLDSEDGRAKIHTQLAKRANDFFDKGAQDPIEDETTAQTWNTGLVCMDLDGGGLHIEIGPLAGLLTFIKKLSVRGTDDDSVILASNARLRPTRVAVPPSSGPWSWVAVDFEDDKDIDLSALDQGALPPDRAIAFRVDADGVGRLLSGACLSPGQHYRLLCPEALWDEVMEQLHGESAGMGWRLVDLSLPLVVSAKHTTALGALGFAVGQPQPRLKWAVTVPDAWNSTLRGDSYASFGEDAPVIFEVSNYGGRSAGDARLYVHGPSGAQTLELPPGNDVVVEMKELISGRYYCTLLHRKTRMQPTHLPFEVLREIPLPPKAAWSITVGGRQKKGEPGKAVVAFRSDLAELDDSSLEAELLGPPGWPVRVMWRELHTEYLDSLSLDEGGELNFSKVLALSCERRLRRHHGDLVLELGELGQAILEHERRLDVDSARGALSQKLADGVLKAVVRQPGAYVQWFPLWHEPICRILGYEAEWVPPDEEFPAPIHAAVARLLITERSRNGIVRSCARILVMLESLDQQPENKVLRWIDEVCRQHKVRTAILSTGKKWSGHRVNQRSIHNEIWDLPAVIEHDQQFTKFLLAVAEGF